MSHFHRIRENSLQRLFVPFPARGSIPRFLQRTSLFFQAGKVQPRATGEHSFQHLRIERRALARALSGHTRGFCTWFFWSWVGPGVLRAIAGKGSRQMDLSPKSKRFWMGSWAAALCGNSLPASQLQRPRILLLKRYLEIIWVFLNLNWVI